MVYDDFDQDMLDAQNAARLLVATGGLPNYPTASNMNKLQHSCALEKVATDYANTLCTDDPEWTDLPPHNVEPVINGVRNLARQFETWVVSMDDIDMDESNVPRVGENIFGWRHFMELNKLNLVDRAVDTWLAQHPNYNFANNTCPQDVPSDQCYHFAQLIWATTTHLGCGYSHCQGGPHDDYIFIVCNYNHAGNFNIHENRPYVPGPPGSQCGNRGLEQPYFENEGQRGPSSGGGLCDGCIPKDFFTNVNATCSVGCNATQQERESLICDRDSRSADSSAVDNTCTNSPNPNNPLGGPVNPRGGRSRKPGDRLPINPDSGLPTNPGGGSPTNPSDGSPNNPGGGIPSVPGRDRGVPPNPGAGWPTQRPTQNQEGWPTSLPTTNQWTTPFDGSASESGLNNKEWAVLALGPFYIVIFALLLCMLCIAVIWLCKYIFRRRSHSEATTWTWTECSESVSCSTGSSISSS